jgi:uncharacterized protein
MLDAIKQLSHQFLKLKNSPYRRYFIQMEPFKHRLSLLLGQRGVGKTTTLVQFLLDSTSQDYFDPSILYVQADHFLMGNTSLYETAEEFQMLGGKILAIDEIHKYANWSQELKSIYDTFPKLTVVASGSSALQMYQGSHDLARRAIKYTMVGLSFREFLELDLQMALRSYTLTDILQNHMRIASEIVDAMEAQNLKILPYFKRYLRCGYYPYFFELPNEQIYFITLEQNLHSTIEGDLAAIYPHLSGSSIQKLKALLIFIAKSVPFTPNWNKIKETLEIGDVRTLRTYFQYLQDASLVRSLSKESHKLSHIGHQEKIYLDNPNQMHALTLGDRNSGTMREIFFLDLLSLNHQVTLPSQGDFLIDGKYLFEVGGKNKSFSQVASEKNAYIVCDDIEAGVGRKIPLWLFGFLY